MAESRAMPLGEAMAAAQALQRVLPLAPYGAVQFTVAAALGRVLPWRAWCSLTHLPLGKKRQRTDRWEGEGQTLAEALHALADELEARKR